MHFIEILPELDTRVAVVGFERSELTLESLEVPHAIWRSDFGLMVAVDTSYTNANDIARMIDICDGAIAGILDKSAADGVELDAHLCFFVDRAESSLSDTFDERLSESRVSMFVSRKYFLDVTDPVSELVGRLTVLWPRFDAASDISMVVAPTPLDLEELRHRIAELGGANAAAQFPVLRA